MNVRFRPDGATVEMKPEEYIFFNLALSYVLHGTRLADHDFFNLLGMSKAEAEALYSEIQALEDLARERGDHWSPRSSGEQG